MAGGNARSERVRRWLSRLPDHTTKVRADIQQGDSWPTVALIAAPIVDPVEAAGVLTDALQEACNTLARRSRGRVVATVQGEELQLDTVHEPDEGVEVVDPSKLDGSADSRVTQMQVHMEGQWRMALQERHDVRVSFGEMFAAQQKIIERLADLVDSSHRRETEARELARSLFQEAVAAAEEEPAESPQSDQMMQLLMPLLLKRLAAGPVTRTQRQQPPAPATEEESE